MIRTRVGAATVIAVGALQVGACTFGPSEELANTDAGIPSSGGSTSGGASATGGAPARGRGTGGRPSTGGSGAWTGGARNGGSGGAVANGGSSSGGVTSGGGSIATGGVSTGGLSNGGSGGTETGGAAAGGSGGAPTGGAPTGGAPTGGTSSGGVGPIDASVPDADASTEGGGGSCGSCPPGQYCDLQALVCRPGCASAAMCASGVCAATHDCERCVGDSECAEGRVCSTGRCLSPCVNTLDCPSGFVCCGNHCADTSRDHRHCSSCTTVCTSGDYCAAVGCKQTTVATICDTPHITFVLSGASTDDALVPVLSAALTSSCPSPPAMSSEPETASSTVNPTTAQPVAGAGDIVVEFGGPYTSNVAKYVESQGLTRVYDTTPNGVVVGFYGHSADGGTDPEVAVVPIAAVSATHDFFKVEMVVDPVSGTRIFQVYGIFAPGTIAAEWFFEHRMLPNLSTYPLRYYVYEWTHGDGGTNPGPSDTFTLLASGN